MNSDICIDKVLIVVNDSLLTQLLEGELKHACKSVGVAKDLEEARIAFYNSDPALIIIDYDVMLGNEKTFLEDLFKQSRRNLHDVPIVILCHHPGEGAGLTEKLPFVKCLVRPFTSKQVLNACVKLVSEISEQKLKEKIEAKNAANARDAKNTDQDNSLYKGEITVKSGEIFIKEGDTDQNMYWLKSGALEVFSSNEAGADLIVGDILQGEVIGEISFLDSKRRSASVGAKVDSVIVIIPYDKFHKVLDGLPPFVNSLILTLCKRLRSS